MTGEVHTPNALPETGHPLLFGKRKHYFQNGMVEIEAINTFEQIRKTVEPDALKTLATSIRDIGLMQPPLVVLFDEEEIKNYLSLLNELWNQNYRVEVLKYLLKRERGVERRLYPVLVYGHRRFLACKQILADRGRRKRLPACFQQRAGIIHLEVRLGIKMMAGATLQCQFSENTYTPPPQHEVARSYNLLYRLLQTQDEDVTEEQKEGKKCLSQAQFARIVGVGEEKVRNALRFCKLPIEIQQAVEDGVLIYGIAVQLARLGEAGCDEDEVTYWVKQAVVERYTVEKLRKKISKFLAQRKADADGQNLMALMSDAQTKASRIRATRNAAQLNTLRALVAYRDFLRQVTYLGQLGYLKLEDSPFVNRSTLVGLDEVLKDTRSLIQHLETLYTEFDLLVLKTHLARGTELIDLLIQRLPELTLPPVPSEANTPELLHTLRATLSHIEQQLPHVAPLKLVGLQEDLAQTHLLIEELEQAANLGSLPLPCQ